MRAKLFLLNPFFENEQMLTDRPIKIAILGSRGIPNRYGGFEEFAEKLSFGLAKKGHDVWVYNSHNHPCRDKEWSGVKRVLCYDPEYLFGQAGQFTYDLNCINDSRRRNFDIILQLGYTSSSVWHFRLPSAAIIITNMDGLEWKRKKYNPLTRKFLKYAEKLAVKTSHHLVADNPAIKEYLAKTYNVSASYIPYGADIPNIAQKPPNTPDDIGIKINDRMIKLQPKAYYLLIARLQPDNHVEEIMQGVLQSGSKHPLLVIGNDSTRYGRYLKKKYRSKQLIFCGSIFKKEVLDKLRRGSKLYFHGHSAGGTNPSLLEAMAASANICAHDNPFNRAVLQNDASYFNSATDITGIINNSTENENNEKHIEANLIKIKEQYEWDIIFNKYEALFQEFTLAKHCHAAT